LPPALPSPRTTPGRAPAPSRPRASWAPAQGSCSPPGTVAAALAKPPPAASAASLPASPALLIAPAPAHALHQTHVSLAAVRSRHTRASDPISRAPRALLGARSKAGSPPGRRLLRQSPDAVPARRKRRRGAARRRGELDSWQAQPNKRPAGCAAKGSRPALLLLLPEEGQRCQSRRESPGRLGGLGRGWGGSGRSGGSVPARHSDGRSPAAAEQSPNAADAADPARGGHRGVQHHERQEVKKTARRREQQLRWVPQPGSAAAPTPPITASAEPMGDGTGLSGHVRQKTWKAACPGLPPGAGSSVGAHPAPCKGPSMATGGLEGNRGRGGQADGAGEAGDPPRPPLPRGKPSGFHTSRAESIRRPPPSTCCDQRNVPAAWRCPRDSLPAWGSRRSPNPPLGTTGRAVAALGTMQSCPTPRSRGSRRDAWRRNVGGEGFFQASPSLGQQLEGVFMAGGTWWGKRRSPGQGRTSSRQK